LKLTTRQWLTVALGAGAALPFSLPAPGGRNSVVPLDLVIWPFLVAALVLTGDREWKGLRRDPIARLLAAFLGVSAVSLPFGVVAYHNGEGLVSFAYQVLIVCNFAAGFLVLRRIADVQLLTMAFVASIGVVALFLDAYLLQAGILASAHTFHNSRFISSLVYGWPNTFSVLVAVALILCAYVIASTDSTNLKRAYAVLAIGLAACILLTFSKTGWVALAVATWLLWMRFWRWRYQALVLAAIVVIGALLLVVGNTSFRIQVFTIGTLQERLQITVDVFRYVNPLVILGGSGSQNLETLLAQTHAELVPGVPLASLSPHDEFMNVLVKGGIVSLALFVAALAIAVLRARDLVRHADRDVARFFRYWYAAAWAVIVSLFAGEELRYWPVAAMFWLIAGATTHFASAGARAGSVQAAPAGDRRRALDEGA
jgi:O-antigen ligase